MCVVVQDLVGDKIRDTHALPPHDHQNFVHRLWDGERNCRRSGYAAAILGSCWVLRKGNALAIPVSFVLLDVRLAPRVGPRGTGGVL